MEEDGKVTCDQEEFEVSQLLEDHCDGSVNRFDRVKGDRKKLGQVLELMLGSQVLQAQ